MRSEHSEGAPIRVAECKQAEHVAAIYSERRKSTGRWRDIAIMYRGSPRARPLEKAFRLGRIPYHPIGAFSILDRAEVKDVMCRRRLLSNRAKIRRFCNWSTYPNSNSAQ
jgi:ATP-dependent DNA helicase Rep